MGLKEDVHAMNKADSDSGMCHTWMVFSCP